MCTQSCVIIYCVGLIAVTVDAMEVLIKYCTNSFPEVDQFIW
jgi:hypothetical protein